MRAKDKYLPVDLDYIEEIERCISQKTSGKIHYFEDHVTRLLDAIGFIEKITKSSDGQFLLMGGKTIRLDKIVTLFGKPGPAYDDYDRYANICFTCENIDEDHGND